MSYPHLLDSLQSKFLDMEPVYCPLGIAELHDGDVLHRGGQVKGYLLNQIPLLLRDVVQCLTDNLGLGSCNDGRQCAFPAVSVLVREYRVQLSIAERSLVYAHVRADVFGEYKPFTCMRTLFPVEVTAQIVTVLTLKKMAIYIVVPLKR